MKVEEILKLALRNEEDIKDNKEIQEFLDKTGMTIQELDLAVLVGVFTGDFSSLEEKLK